MESQSSTEVNRHSQTYRDNAYEDTIQPLKRAPLSSILRTIDNQQAKNLP